MKTDFLIIGGGAIGLCSAIALLEEGYKVTLIDRNATGSEASWAGGGILSPLCSWDYSEKVTSLTERSMGMFEDMADQLLHHTGIDPEYQRCGMLILPPFQEKIATAWCKAHQVIFNHVRLDEHLQGMQGAGLFMPDIAQVRNPRLLQALRRRFEMLGGNMLEHQEALSFEISGHEVKGLSTNKEKLTADAYIMAAGAWSKTLLGEHAMGMEVRPIRGQMLLFKFEAPPFSNILLQKELYIIPRTDGHVLVGSTLEDVGFNKSITTEAMTYLLGRVRTLFPDWPSPIRQWAGLRPGSPDNIPTIGPHPRLSNLYANCGHFRYGVTMSPASARLLLDAIQGHTDQTYRWRE